MSSWTVYDERPWDWDTSADRYQRDMDNAFLEDMRLGVEPRYGWRGRPVDPMCPAHGYGMPDGRGCGVCVMEQSAAYTAQREHEERAA